MTKEKTQLFILAGLWCSFSAILIASTIFLPATKPLQNGSVALLYRLAIKNTPPYSVTLSLDAKTLVADLEKMTLSVYDRAELVRAFNILSIGREGTSWQTPTGRYSIQTKEKEHYSSIGGTWMPYSMQFYGNFFIHGWPTYSDGREVSKGYSGGCIRLSTDDARDLYELTPQGTRVIVLNGEPKEKFATSSNYFIRGTGRIPHISAKSFSVADADTGRVLWERSPDSLSHPGNLVSLLSALTAVETVNQYKLVRLSELLLGKGVLRSRSIDARDEMPAGTLIYPLLFDTNDTAAKVFAHEHGTKRFVSFMNEKGTAIGMEHSAFSGALSTDAATTTTRDIMTLLRYVNKEKPFLISVSLAKDRTLMNDDGRERYQWENKNLWVKGEDSSYRGGIADIRGDGSGNAALLFSLPLLEFGTRTIALVVMDSSDVEKDIIALKNFVTDHFIYGIQNKDTLFIPEENDSLFSLSKQMINLQLMEKMISADVFYDKDI